MSKDQVENVQRQIDVMQAGSDETMVALPALTEFLPYINYLGLTVGSWLASRGWVANDDTDLVSGIVVSVVTLAVRLWVKRRRIVVRVTPQK